MCIIFCCELYKTLVYLLKKEIYSEKKLIPKTKYTKKQMLLFYNGCTSVNI